ncbi:DnaD domain-containing protein [Bacillus thuringiensis]|uniref:DnaD domain-containing protein n=1 Tax=Bacillus thuringiensis TaxID=1428 RepID=UPI00119FC7C5|nr:DnaD domain protein [Bacillus thuringiensis]
MSNYQTIRTIISQISGQDNIVVVPKLFVKLTGDITTAILLNQIVFYSDKSKRTDGFFYKTYKEWKDEICLTERQVRYSTRKLVDRGLVETVLKKANGAPTVHYKLDYNKLVESILTLCQNPTLQSVGFHSDKTLESLTETTTENTTKKVSSSNIFAFYENNFGILNPFVADSITQWANDTSEELVIAAMERALKQQKKWNYAEGILKQWASQNIKTLSDVEALEAEYQRNKGAKNNAKSGGSNTNRYSQKGEYDYGF